jgi:hypothetical protein
MGWGDTSTAGDPGEQSAADASQSASVDSATAGSNAGSIGGGGGNDGNVTGTMDPGQMQGAGLNAGYGFAAQDAYNTAHGITATNPYGKQGFFSRVFGIDPQNIDYSQNMDLSTRLSIANNQFSKYANPTNTPGQLGYNPDFAPAPPGQLRAGVQKAGFQTVYGPVMEQARLQSLPEMAARGLAGLFGGLPGMALGQIGTKEYGLPGQPGFDSFDPNNPRAGGGILGAMFGGVNPTQAAEKAAQAVDSLRSRFSPNLGPTTNAGIGSLTPASYETRADIRNRVAPTSPQLGSVFEVDGRSFIAGKNGPIELSGVSLPNFRSENPAEATIDKGQGRILGVEDYLQSQFAAPANQFSTLTSKMNEGLSDARSGALSGIQNTGLLGENPKAPGFRALEDSIRSIINKENLPDNQNMYGPGMPDLSPGELNGILAPYDMELGRGPATANQYAQVDYSNLNNVGGNLYQAGQQKNAFDSLLETFGMKETSRRPSGQIYSPAGNNKSFFEYLGLGQ